MPDTLSAGSVNNRYFEDYVEGSTHDFGPITVTEEEILSFGKQFDPQPMHTDPNAAQDSIFGGLIASGWHTAAMTMRILVEQYLSYAASLGSPGVEKLRWLQPVRPGDELSVRVTVIETRRSRSKPDRGIVRSFIEVYNQDHEIVMDMTATNFMRCRES